MEMRPVSANDVEAFLLGALLLRHHVGLVEAAHAESQGFLARKAIDDSGQAVQIVDRTRLGRQPRRLLFLLSFRSLFPLVAAFLSTVSSGRVFAKNLRKFRYALF